MSELLNDPAQLPSYRDLIGVIPTVSAVPTWVPRNIAEQVVIYNSTLYMYDTSTGTWNTVGASAGSNTQVIFNDGGSLSGDSDLTFTKGTYPTIAVGADDSFGQVTLATIGRVYASLYDITLEGIGNGTDVNVRGAIGTSNNGPGGSVNLIGAMGSLTGSGRGGDITLSRGIGTGSANWGAIEILGQYFSSLHDNENSGSSITIPWYQGNVHLLTLTAATVTISFAQPKSGAIYTLILQQDATGSRTVTWPTIKWAGGSPPTLSTAANAIDVITLIYAGTSYLGRANLNFA